MNGSIRGTEEEVNEQWDPRLRFRIKALNLREWLVTAFLGKGNSICLFLLPKSAGRKLAQSFVGHSGQESYGAGDAMFCMEVSTS